MAQSRVVDFVGTTRFEVRSRLGEGGGGVVYRAFDRDRNGIVALKTLRSLSPESLLVLKTEFRAVQDLDHPNLVKLGELFEVQGRWFFTMEYVDGVPLNAYVRPGDGTPSRPPPPASESPGRPGFDEARVRSAFAQLARGLSALHGANKVHRDVKPSNVLVTAAGRVVILDFGVVSDLARNQGRTEGGIIGTAAYMAPEQAASEAVGPAADWYAVGVVLFHALTGRLPFTGSTHELLEQKLLGEAPSPDAAVADLPRDLSSLCQDLLRGDAAARPSGAAVLERLRGEAPTIETRRSSRGALFVGRNAELATLRSAFRDARGGEPHSVVVHGESGVGKSSMVRAFLEEVRELEPATIVFTGRCYERESVPYKAFDPIVDDVSRYLAQLPPSEALALVPEHAGLLAQAFPVLRSVAAFDTPAPSAGDVVVPKEVRLRLFGALREVLTRIAARAPLVLVIDDLQWADADSLAILTALFRPPDAPKALLVATVRTSTEARAAHHAMEVPGRVTHVYLEKLSPDEAHELVTRLLASKEQGGDGEADVRAIAAEAMGHPLFIDELVRHRAATGSGGARVRLDEALWNRVSAIDPASRAVVELLAVAGIPIAQQTAAAAASMELGQLFDVLSVLRAAKLVRTDGARASDVLCTYHDRVRESVLGHLTLETRKLWHGRLALALEQSGTADPETLAVHWKGAERRDRAATYTTLAADQAAKALAFDRAARLYREALALSLSTRDELRALRFKLVEALTNAGRLGEAAEARLALADESEPTEALELRRVAAEQLLCSGRFDEGLSLVRVAVAAANLRFPETPLAALLSILWYRAALWLRGLDFRERPIEAADPREVQRVDVGWSAGSGLLMTDNIRGIYYQSSNLLHALRLGDPVRVLRVVVMAALAGGAPNRGRTERLLAVARALAARVGTPYAHGMVALAEGGSAYFWGEWARAAPALERAEVYFRDRCLGTVFELNSCHLMLHRVLTSLGAFRRLAEVAPTALADAEARNDIYALINLRCVSQVSLALAANDVDRATRILDLVTEQLSGRGYHVQHYVCANAQGQLDLFQGRGAWALERLATVVPQLKKSMLLRVPLIRILTFDQRARAAIGEARERHGRRSELLALAEQDAARLDREGVAWADAFAIAARAGIASVRGDTESAVVALRRAVAAFDETAMAAHAAGARIRLGRLLGGAEGDVLVARGEGFFRAEGNASPERMIELVAPGFG